MRTEIDEGAMRSRLRFMLIKSYEIQLPCRAIKVEAGQNGTANTYDRHEVPRFDSIGPVLPLLLLLLRGVNPVPYPVPFYATRSRLSAAVLDPCRKRIGRAAFNSQFSLRRCGLVGGLPLHRAGYPFSKTHAEQACSVAAGEWSEGRPRARVACTKPRTRDGTLVGSRIQEGYIRLQYSRSALASVGLLSSSAPGCTCKPLHRCAPPCMRRLRYAALYDERKG